MQRWFYERMLWVRNHPVYALGLLASIITIVTFIATLIGPTRPPVVPPPLIVSTRPPDAIVIGANRGSLRETHGVRGLSPLEENMRISQLPNGVFGFTMPLFLRVPSALRPAGNTTLAREMDGVSNTEIHKTREGGIFVLVYVDEISLLQLQNPERVDTLDIIAFLMPHEPTDQLSAIPLSRLKNWNARRSSEYGTLVDITVN